MLVCLLLYLWNKQMHKEVVRTGDERIKPPVQRKPDLSSFLAKFPNYSLPEGPFRLSQPLGEKLLLTFSLPCFGSILSMQFFLCLFPGFSPASWLRFLGQALSNKRVCFRSPRYLSGLHKTRVPSMFLLSLFRESKWALKIMQACNLSPRKFRHGHHWSWWLGADYDLWVGNLKSRFCFGQ